MILHIVGNRPQLIKLAPLSRELRRRGYEDIIVHTGQHYDKNMSDIFFHELGIVPPYKNIHVGSGSHAYVTGTAMIELEKIMLELKPRVVIVYGDTNSTLAAAIAAAKLGIPVVHIEAGPRTYAANNPEEINRKLVDHISSILCCPDRTSVENLKKENKIEGVYYTGDIMYDTFLYYREQNPEELLKRYRIEAENYVLMTWHRQENTENKERIKAILNFITKIQYPILCPIHPRTKKMMEKFGLAEKALHIANFKMIEPVGYIEMVALMNCCRFVLCDSGGVSKEAYFAGKKCIFMLSFNPWKELVDNGNVITIDFDNEDDIRKKQSIANELEAIPTSHNVDIFGNGRTAENVVKILEKHRLL